MSVRRMKFAGWTRVSELISEQSGAIERPDREGWHDQSQFFKGVTLAALGGNKLVADEDEPEV